MNDRSENKGTGLERINTKLIQKEGAQDIVLFYSRKYYNVIKGVTLK